MSSNCLFCLTNSTNLKRCYIYSDIKQKRKKQILTFNKPETATVWHVCLMNDFDDSSTNHFYWRFLLKDVASCIDSEFEVSYCLLLTYTDKITHCSTTALSFLTYANCTTGRSHQALDRMTSSSQTPSVPLFSISLPLCITDPPFQHPQIYSRVTTWPWVSMTTCKMVSYVNQTGTSALFQPCFLFPTRPGILRKHAKLPSLYSKLKP